MGVSINFAVSPGAMTADAAGFDAVIGPYIEDGYRLAAVMLRDGEEARDAVQEASLRAWRGFSTLKDQSAAKSWFFAIVANQCRNTRKGRWWSVVRLAEPRASFSYETAGDERLDLERAFAALDVIDRLVVYLRYRLDLPMDEVGRIAGLSEAGARTRVHRALKKLRPELEIQEGLR
jgi:RNA polymerase sigma-70 factor, ECF subfamily